MKKKEKDYEYLDTPPEVLERGLRYITRPKSLDRILGKSRITIFLDADIVTRFKETAEKEGIGYQTLINNALRRIVDGEQKEVEKEELKNELLKDKQFLRKLKTELA